MSDTAYPVFQHYGTHAARLAFTPSPPATGQPIYIWYETDTGNSYLYDTSWHQITTTATGNVTAAGTLTSNALVIGQGTTAVAVTTTGTGILTALGINTGSAGAPVLFNGAGGTPSSLTGTNITGIPTTGLLTGAQVQVVNTETAASTTGTTIIPSDDTIPQITEGTEFMTLAVTPKSATNKLKIEVVLVGSMNISPGTLTVALFQDATANALAAVMVSQVVNTGLSTVVFSHYMTSGTTSATTFRVRAGGNGASTTTFNGNAGARLMGGVMASSITITEIAV